MAGLLASTGAYLTCVGADERAIDARSARYYLIRSQLNLGVRLHHRLNSTICLWVLSPSMPIASAPSEHRSKAPRAGRAGPARGWHRAFDRIVGWCATRLRRGHLAEVGTRITTVHQVVRHAPVPGAMRGTCESLVPSLGAAPRAKVCLAVHPNEVLNLSGAATHHGSRPSIPPSD
jgi:hypothetical protein